MIRRIEALDFRCLRYVRQELADFHVLVGPNASGKTTFLDVVAFLGQLVSRGLDYATGERTSNFQDLVFARSGGRFELALETEIPEARRLPVWELPFDRVRYEMALAADPQTGEVSIAAENVLLKQHTPGAPVQRELFPHPGSPPSTIITQKYRGASTTRLVVTKVPGGNDNFYSESYAEKGKGWAPAFRLGPRKSALGNLPEDESKFPVATWLKRFLADGVQQIVLNSLLIRKASPPGQARGFKTDGSNLPWVAHALKERDPERFRSWVRHVQTALPDIVDISTIERPDDKHRYLMVHYVGGFAVPSWMTSDGTLRLLALTLPAYLYDFEGVYLIEEPENGIHPRAVETVFQSLSSVYGAQILMATHSPVVLSTADASHILCFAKSDEGATDIVLGSEHPALQEWRGETNLGVLFAGGVLG